MNSFLIVDGSNLLFQMFYGMPARILSKSGKPIHAVLGFVGALLKLINISNPDNVIVLFDGEHDDPRRDIYSDYKSNRVGYADVPDEENPFVQLDDIKRAISYLEIAHYETVNCEADDLIAAYVASYQKSTQIYIATQDSDMLQLIADNVSVIKYRASSSVILDRAAVISKYGVQPSQFADYKALIGDKSDNIPGAPSVGPKTAASLLNKYGCLDSIIKNANDIERTTIRAAIISSTDTLRVGYSLIKLGTNVELPYLLDELTYRNRGLTTREVLAELDIL